MPSYTTDPITTQGIAAAKIGRRADARRYFEIALSRDHGNVAAWWWLAKVTDDAHASYQYREKCRSVAVTNQAGLEVYRLLLQEAGVPVLRRYQLRPDSKSVNGTCPIDSTPLMSGDIVILCPRCHIAHHVDCWESLGAYNCGGIACEGEGLVDHDAPPLFQGPADTATVEIDDETIKEVAPYASREEKEEGFINRLMLANFRRQAELARAVAADRRRQAAVADRARRIQQQEEARAQREEAQRAAEMFGRVTLAYLAGLIPGTIIAIAANAYFHDWLVFLFIVFLGATSLSTVAGHAYMDADTDRLTSILYWLFPKITAAVILYFSYKYWENGWLAVILAYLGGNFLVERILRIRALYERRTFLTYSAIALVVLFTFRYFSINNP
jgi:hypothetical protein